MAVPSIIVPDLDNSSKYITRKCTNHYLTPAQKHNKLIKSPIQQYYIFYVNIFKSAI